MAGVSGEEQTIFPGIVTLGLPPTPPVGPLGTLAPASVAASPARSRGAERRSRPVPPDDGTPVLRFAEALGCVPETLIGLALLHGSVLRGAPVPGGGPLLLSDTEWPMEWRAQAYFRHSALAVDCADELELTLRLVAAWERADDDRRPWEASVTRRRWADQWWVDHEVLIQAADLRQQALDGMAGRLPSTARPTDVGLAARARAAIVSAFTDHLHLPGPNGGYIPAAEADYVGPEAERSILRPFVPRLVGAPVVALARDDTVDVPELRNLVRVPAWCHPSGDEGTAHAEMRLLLDLHELRDADHTAAEISREWPAMARRWPVGARVVVELAPGHGDRRAVLAARDWTAAPRQPDAPMPTTDLAAGGTRPSSLDVPPAWREDEDEAGPDDRAVDEVVSPIVGVGSTSSTEPDRTAAVVRAAPSDDRYEVVGYEVVDGAWAPVLAGDRIAPSFIGDPGAHHDLEAGTEIDLIVGAAVRVDRAEARILHRADGRGRFVLPDGVPRRARGAHDVDPGLWAGERGFAVRLREGAVLTGTVVVGPVGSTAVSLVPTLTEHLQWAHQGVLPRGDGGNFPAWPATITKVADRGPKQGARGGAHGEITLLHHDAESGIRYRFNLPPDTPGLEVIEQEEGRPLLVRVAYSEERVRLPGPPSAQRREELDAVCADDPKGLRVEQAASGSTAELVTSRPMTAEIRGRLLDLDDGAPWRSAVWTLFTRSHVRRVRGVGSIGSFDDVRFAPVPLPGPARRAVIDKVEEGMLLRGQVLPSTDDAVRVDLGLGMRGRTSRRLLSSPDRFMVGADVVGRVCRVDRATRRITLDLESHTAVPDAGSSDVRDFREALTPSSSIPVTAPATKVAGPLAEPTTEPAIDAALEPRGPAGAARVVRSDDDLRTIIEDLRDGVRVEVDIEGSTVLGRTELMAFLSGVSSAFVGGSLTVTNTTARVENRGRSTAPRRGSGRVRSYALRALDEDASTAVSLLRLGDGLRLTLPTNEAERELIMWFFVGVTETLHCAWKLSDDRNELMLG